MKTIVAISTPLAKGAISIVRMSGKNALTIAQKFFTPLKKQKLQPRKMALGKFDLGSSFEKCLMVFFEAPNSYTGEDMVEFHLHGGIVLTQLVQQKLLQAGAQLAEPGEFTKLAFLNGKISLDEAEGIIDEINSESEAELKAALASADGELNQKVKLLQHKLKDILAEIEVSLDYPEEVDFEVLIDNIIKSLKVIKTELSVLISNSEQLKFVKSGINVAIVGRTNVGKSSLLNALIGEEKAIVTEIEGTTRDIVEAKADFKGVRFNFFDTAGIRESDDLVEKIGIEKSKKMLKDADLVLVVLDGSEKLSSDDKKIIDSLKQPHLFVVNKSDKKRVLEKMNDEIEVSAKDKKNLQLLKESILQKTIGEDFNFNASVLANERQLEILKEALKQTKQAILEKSESMEILSLVIKNIWQTLGKITGETENEDIIDLIFSRFCVGK